MKFYFSRLLIYNISRVFERLSPASILNSPLHLLFQNWNSYLQEKMQVLFPAVLNPLCAAAVGEGLWVTHQPGSGQPFYFLRLPVDQFWRLIPPSPPSFTNSCKSCRCRNLNTSPGEPGTIVLLPWYLFVTSVTLFNHWLTAAV